LLLLLYNDTNNSVADGLAYVALFNSFALQTEDLALAAQQQSSAPADSKSSSKQTVVTGTSSSGAAAKRATDRVYSKL
jgi:BRCT domain type II-containing protein